MKSIFLLKRSSIRTKFIVFTLSVFSITNIIVAVYYPLSEYNKEYRRLKSRFSEEIQRMAAADNSESLQISDYDELFISNLFSNVEQLPEMEYIATEYFGKKYTDPADIYNFDLIDSLRQDVIHQLKNEYVLALSVPVKLKGTIGIITLRLGVNAQSIIAAERGARYLTYLMIVVSALIIYLFVFFFDKVIYTPFKKLINISRFVSIGQDRFEQNDDLSQEFNQIVGYLEIAAKRITELKQDNKLIPISLKKSQEKAAKIQKDLDREIEAMSNLIIYILELRKEKTEESIYKNLVQEITMQLGYSVCFLFKFENNKLKYYKSNLRGMQVLDEKLRVDLKNFIITDGNQIVKEMHLHNPLIYSKLPFEDILQKYNIIGQYALIPVSTASNLYGMMIVGKIGEDQTIEHKELEKLMLLANTVGLHLENLNSMALLERSVEKRTSELEITNKLLSNSITEKDTMLKLVSHDLNAPLRNVIGLVESIERKFKGEMDTDLTDRLLRIRKNVEKELNMIDEILTSFRSEDTVDVSQQIDTRNLVQSILDELNYELNRKNVKVILEDNLPIIVSNQAIMKHIFLNLIDNACKYMPFKMSGNEIKISFSKDDSNSVFRVADNGTGIPKEKQEYIFDSYQKAGASPDDSAGKGLGLALVKNMVGKIKGEISFNSKENKGSTFFISFKNDNNQQGKI